MSTKIRSALTLTLLMFALPAVAAPPAGRERIRLDNQWRFQLETRKPATGGQLITRWLWKPTDGDEAQGAFYSSASYTTENLWKPVEPRQDVFNGRLGTAWFRAELPAQASARPLLHFESVDDNATVFLNGKRLAIHEGWNEPFDVSLESVWKPNSPNILAVLVQNTDGPGGIGETLLQQAPPEETDGPAATNYDDSQWRSLHLPHDFVVEGTFTPTADASHGSLPVGIGWYRRVFSLPTTDMGRALWLEFDGIYRNSDIWLNGKKLGSHKSGYIGARFDISDRANYGGTNTLVVRVDARSPEGWWYEGGGIYRHVWLNKADPIHIAPAGVFVIAQPQADKSAAITVKVEMALSGQRRADYSLTTDILDSAGRRVAQVTKTGTQTGAETAQYDLVATIPNARLWSIETPTLYRAVTRIAVNGKTVDSVTTAFGVRSFRFDAKKGFFLNGKPVKIQGTCNHQDFAGLGIAMPDSLLEWRIRKLKEMGSNAYRCSHNPPAAELLEACDRLGMIVMDETRHLGDVYTSKTPASAKYDDFSDLKELIRRDRNHPSIVLWSMCNEEPLQGSETGAKIFSAMKAATLVLDPTRPISSAMNGGWGQGISLVQDVQGCNYNPRGYDDYHKRFPDQPVYGSETASEVGTRGEYVNDRKKGYVSAYSVNAPPWAQTSEVAWKALAEREFMAGGFVWTGFDYKGEPTPYGWPCVNSHFGIMDMCGFPKDAYYYYKAWWGDKPVVHILPHWNWPGKEGQEIKVWVHSNAEKVELLLNGKSLGVKEMPKWGHLEWAVPYTAGRLEARGTTQGKLVATDVVETTGEPASLRLTPDRKTMLADGEDVILVTVEVLDAKGRVVPYAENEVLFTVEGAGRVAGVGNGDPSSHEPDKSIRRKAFHGLCMAILQAGEKAGTITVNATALGVKSADLTLSAK